jgi:hypothetical protein
LRPSPCALAVQRATREIPVVVVAGDPLRQIDKAEGAIQEFGGLLKRAIAKQIE